MIRIDLNDGHAIRIPPGAVLTIEFPEELREVDDPEEVTLRLEDIAGIGLFAMDFEVHDGWVPTQDGFDTLAVKRLLLRDPDTDLKLQLPMPLAVVPNFIAAFRQGQGIVLPGQIDGLGP